MYLERSLSLFSDFFLLITLLLLLIQIATLLVECTSTLLPAKSKESDQINSKDPRPSVAVLMPAHNEAEGIKLVLLNLLPQITERDRLIVIADNCTDNTAEIARDCGATVIERHNSNLRGKGYALDYGLQFLETQPPEVVVMVDADCLVGESAIALIARLAAAENQPVQALYLMEQTEGDNIKNSVSALAFTIKNLVRPSGLKKLNLPCVLTGSGMAFGWSIIQKISLASDNIVEDMQLTIDLAIAGYPSLFCPEARITGILPQQETATTSQRTRWEHGHLNTIRTQVPRLVKAAIVQKRLDLLALALDLFVPPLSLLVFVWIAATASSILIGSFQHQWLFTILFGIEGLLIFLSIFAAYVRFGNQQIPIKLLVATPFYLLWKLPIYLSFLFKPQRKWIRTERNKAL